MTDPESRKAPCQNCRPALKGPGMVPGVVVWRACCGTWTMNMSGKIIRPRYRLS